MLCLIKKNAPAIAVIVSGLWVPLVAAEQSADSLLARMDRAFARTPFSGVQRLHVAHGDTTMELKWRVVHWPPGRTLITFVEPAGARGTSLLVDGRDIRVVGDRHLKRVLRSRSARRMLPSGPLFRNFALLHKNYHISARPSGKLAGYEVTELQVQPRHPFRPSLRVLVENQSALPLRFERIPRAGSDRPVDVREFEDIRFVVADTTRFSTLWQQADTLQKKSRRRYSSGSSYSSIAELLNSYSGPLLLPESLPAGFELQRVRVFQRKGRKELHFMYSDGLVYLSLFQRPRDGEHEDKTSDRHKRRYSRTIQMIRAEKAGMVFYLVGDIAAEELQAMADSLVPVRRSMWSPMYTAVVFTVALLAGLLFVLRRRR